jgi:hypothetical protein
MKLFTIKLPSGSCTVVCTESRLLAENYAKDTYTEFSIEEVTTLDQAIQLFASVSKEYNHHPELYIAPIN